MILVKFSPLGILWGPSYDHFYVSHVDPHIPNIGYMLVYEGLQALGGFSFLQARNFTLNALKIMSGDLLGPEL